MMVVVVLLTDEVVPNLCDFLLGHGYLVQRPHPTHFNGYTHTAYLKVTHPNLTTSKLGNSIKEWFKEKAYIYLNLVVMSEPVGYYVDEGEDIVPKKTFYDVLSAGGIKLK